MRLLTLAVMLLLACACEIPVPAEAEPQPPTTREVCEAWCSANGARFYVGGDIPGGLRCSCDLMVVDMVAMPRPETTALPEAPTEE